MQLKRILYLIIEKLLSRSTDRIVCISEAEQQTALREKICKKDKLYLIPNGIDIKQVLDAPPVSRESIGFNNSAFIVGMIGRLSRQKAPDVFIRTAEIIRKTIPNVAFIIVGEGEEREEIEGYARERKIPLFVTGWVDNPYSYLKIFDVSVLLSRWEGFGLAIAEYMAARKPIVATRIDAIPTLIEDGEDGLLVNVDSPMDAAEKVIFIYKHKDVAIKMTEKAFEKVSLKYDICRVAEQHCRLFDSLMGGEL